MYLVMELCAGGELFDAICMRQRFSEKVRYSSGKLGCFLPRFKVRPCLTMGVPPGCTKVPLWLPSRCCYSWFSFICQ